MSLLRPFSIFIRNALIKQHPYFSCCASCGEIKTPLGRRLCTSLAPEFPVDAVILSGEKNTSQDMQASLASLGTYAPWLRKIYVQATTLPDGASSKCTLLPEVFLTAAEYSLHNLAELSEEFIVMESGCVREKNIEILDLYTPNGVPLLPVEEQLQGEAPALPAELLAAFEKIGLSPEPYLVAPATRIRAHCKNIVKQFVPLYALLSSCEDTLLRTAFVQFIYASALAVPTLYHAGEPNAENRLPLDTLHA